MGLSAFGYTRTLSASHNKLPLLQGYADINVRFDQTKSENSTLPEFSNLVIADCASSLSWAFPFIPSLLPCNSSHPLPSFKEHFDETLRGSRAMTGNIVDYRVDRYGNVYGKCYCGTEYKLTDGEVRRLAISKPEVFLVVASS